MGKAKGHRGMTRRQFLRAGAAFATLGMGA